SNRVHTSAKRYLSSDVCSSDLWDPSWIRRERNSDTHVLRIWVRSSLGHRVRVLRTPVIQPTAACGGVRPGPERGRDLRTSATPGGGTLGPEARGPAEDGDVAARGGGVSAVKGRAAMSEQVTVRPADGYAGDLECADAWRMLEADPQAVLVDVRTRAEWD